MSEGESLVAADTLPFPPLLLDLRWGQPGEPLWRGSRSQSSYTGCRCGGDHYTCSFRRGHSSSASGHNTAAISSISLLVASYGVSPAGYLILLGPASLNSRR
ncbi:unnamed protein product [Linum trigynum]|uniref:Uncharacterized protein n=1 Tax=Linum trigynum TaxID=586398 RepID=A0AAV2DYU6_9ROSI